MKITKDEILYLNALENISGVTAKTCIVLNGNPNFLIEKSRISRAIGKNGEMIRKIRRRMGKKVEIFRFSNKADEFVKHAFPGAAVQEVRILENGSSKILQLTLDAEARSKILNNNPRLRKVKGIVERYYGISSIKLR